MIIEIDNVQLVEVVSKEAAVDLEHSRFKTGFHESPQEIKRNLLV